MTPAGAARIRGIRLLVVAGLCFGAMMLLTKLAERALPAPEVAALRFGAGVVAVVAYAIARARAGAPLRVRGADLLAIRGLAGGGAVLLLFLAIQHAAVGIATLLNYTSPAFAAIFAWLFLGEAVRRRTLTGMIVAGAGVLLLVLGRPGAGRAHGGAWLLLALASGVLSGAAVTAIRAARRTDGAWEIFGAFSVLGLAITGPTSLCAGLVRPSPTGWLLIAGIGLLSIAAQICMTTALAHVETATAGVLFQITPVSAYALGVLALGDRLGGLAAIGALVTLAGITVCAREPPVSGVSEPASAPLCD